MVRLVSHVTTTTRESNAPDWPVPPNCSARRTRKFRRPHPSSRRLVNLFSRHSRRRLSIHTSSTPFAVSSRGHQASAYPACVQRPRCRLSVARAVEPLQRAVRECSPSFTTSPPQLARPARLASSYTLSANASWPVPLVQLLRAVPSALLGCADCFNLPTRLSTAIDLHLASPLHRPASHVKAASRFEFYRFVQSISLPSQFHCFAYTSSPHRRALLAAPCVPSNVPSPDHRGRL
jgi:hypothetical protein